MNVKSAPPITAITMTGLVVILLMLVAAGLASTLGKTALAWVIIIALGAILTTPIKKAMEAIERSERLG